MTSVQWVATAVGIGLVLFPEPATTATGLAILAANLGYTAIQGRLAAPKRSSR